MPGRHARVLGPGECACLYHTSWGEGVIAARVDTDRHLHTAVSGGPGRLSVLGENKWKLVHQPCMDANNGRTPVSLENGAKDVGQAEDEYS